MMKDTAHRKGTGCDGKVTAIEIPAAAVTWPGKDSRVSPGGSAGVQHQTQATTIGTENCKACCHTITILLLLSKPKGRSDVS